jgi:hypothetical protein
MSFPSIVGILKEKNIDVETANDESLADPLWEAFHRDTPEAILFLEGFAADLAKSGQKRLRHDGDPNSSLAKQVNRLLGTDIARRVCEQKLGVSFALLNCHSPIVAWRREDLSLSIREQIMLQNGVFASADC